MKIEQRGEQSSLNVLSGFIFNVCTRFCREIILVSVCSWKIEINKFEIGRIVDQDYPIS